MKIISRIKKRSQIQKDLIPRILKLEPWNIEKKVVTRTFSQDTHAAIFDGGIIRKKFRFDGNQKAASRQQDEGFIFAKNQRYQ